jgi:hypothetical protein
MIPARPGPVNPAQSGRRPVVSVLIAAKCVYAALYLVVFTLLVAYAHARITFSARPWEVDMARSCVLAPECPPTTAGYVDDQLAMLSRMSTAVHASAWSGVALEALALILVATLVFAGARATGSSPVAARVLGVFWKAQAAIAVAWVVLYLGLLLQGAALLSRTPDSAAILIFKVAFDAPLFRFSTLYYLTWFVAANAVAVGLNVILSRALRPSLPR